LGETNIEDTDILSPNCNMINGKQMCPSPWWIHYLLSNRPYFWRYL